MTSSPGSLAEYLEFPAIRPYLIICAQFFRRPRPLVPTVSVGMPGSTLRVVVPSWSGFPTCSSLQKHAVTEVPPTRRLAHRNHRRNTVSANCSPAVPPYLINSAMNRTAQIPRHFSILDHLRATFSGGDISILECVPTPSLMNPALHLRVPYLLTSQRSESLEFSAIRP